MVAAVGWRLLRAGLPTLIYWQEAKGAVETLETVKYPAAGPAPKPPYLPARCRRAPNASYDRSFGIFLCDQRDARCHFYGPVYVQDQEGRQYECRKRDG